MTEGTKKKFSPERFAELCEKKGLDPAEMVMKILELERDDLKAKDRLDAGIKLMEYLYPKQRAVEHSGNLNIGLPDLLSQAEEAWHKRDKQDP